MLVAQFICIFFSMKVMSIDITLEFTGGAELLFGNVKQHNVSLPSQEGKWTLRMLIQWILNNLVKERPDLFAQGETVRPGILVLVNDTDWELLGQLDYEIEQGDNVVFISTLHGG